MGFDSNKFMTANLVYSEAAVVVSDLKPFFDDDSDPVWKVRNLTGPELARVNEEVKVNRDLGALIEQLTSEDAKEKIDAIKDSLGISDRTPDDVVRRIKMLEYGSVDPEVDQEFCVRLSDKYPTIFFALTNKIIELTGQGSRLGE